MNSDNRRIYELLTPPEVAILLTIDPEFQLPAGVPHGKAKMRAARAIHRRGGSDVVDVERMESRYSRDDLEREAA